MSKWHYEDDLVVVCDCLSCKVPMIVLRKHTVQPSLEEVEYAIKICKKLFGENISLRTQQRKIPDHFHWHVFNK